jgi:putative hydrolase of the HAD superfamily
MPLDLVVFDLDDTLFPEEEFVRSGFRAASCWLEATHNVPGLLSVATELFEGGMRERIFDCALQRLQITSEALVSELVKVYRQHLPDIRLFEDAQWVLEDLRDSYSLGLITDGHGSVQRNKVKALAIESRFDAIVYSDDFGRENWKPSVMPYRKIMAVTKARAEKCVYVADNPGKDFIGARSLKWKTVHVQRPRGIYESTVIPTGYEADVTIRSLYNLPEILSISC